MLTKEQILSKLDSYKLGYYCQFINPGSFVSYLLDCRLNVFKLEDKWAIVGERTGYNPSGGGIELEIYYFGNCLMNLENYNKQDVNYYTVRFMDWKNFSESLTEEENIKPEAISWKIRSIEIELIHDSQAFADAGIEIEEYVLNEITGEPNPISIVTMARLLVAKQPELFRATDEELYKSIPAELQKLMILDEWFHKDYLHIDLPATSNDHLKTTYDFNKTNFGIANNIDFDSFATMFRQQEQSTNQFNKSQWQDNRPSSYETWQLLAKVIATGDTSLYKPTSLSNTHWKNWPNSGTM